jgi:hypothetical protein
VPVVYIKIFTAQATKVGDPFNSTSLFPKPLPPRTTAHFPRHRSMIRPPAGVIKRPAGLGTAKFGVGCWLCQPDPLTLYQLP